MKLTDFKIRINLFLTKLILPIKLRNRADRYFDKTVKEFVKTHKRIPDRDEIFLLVVKSSHRTLGIKKSRGKKGHIKRQWIRKYLLLKNNIRSRYKIQR